MSVPDSIKDATETIKTTTSNTSSAVVARASEAADSIKDTISSTASSITPSNSSPSSGGGPTTQATRAEMSTARLPLAYRDTCAHLLIPLNTCRYDNYYLPWRCENERHSYEKCQYEEFKLRVKKMEEMRAAKGGGRSN